jgi:tetratricopeptide (TPR) repeat protein
MDVEKVKAIASLWKLAAVAFAFVFLAAYRGQIGDLLARLARLVRLKRGKTELILEESKPTPQLSSEAAAPPPTAPGPHLTETNEKSPPATTNGPSSSLVELLVALEARDTGRFEQAYLHLQRSEPDAQKKLHNEAYYQYGRFKLGNESALDELRTLTTKPGAASFAWYWLGACFELGHDYDRATHCFLSAADASTEAGRKANCAVAAARCTANEGDVDRSVTLLGRFARDLQGDDAQFTLYKGLSKVFEITGEKELEAIALEPALGYRPNATELHFSAAYRYSAVGIDQLATLHYTALLGFEPRHPAALNNLGVQYERAGLPINSVALYESATEEKETLAAANLAYRLLDAGFADQARHQLREALQTEKPHARVGEALAALDARREGEEAEKTKILKEAEHKRGLLQQLGRQILCGSNPVAGLQGEWAADDGDRIRIGQDSRGISGEWSNAAEQYRFVGHPIGGVATLEIEKREYSFAVGQIQFARWGHGLACLLEGGTSLLFLAVSSEEAKTSVLKRA